MSKSRLRSTLLDSRVMRAFSRHLRRMRSKVPRTEAHHLREAGGKIKQKMVFNTPRTVSAKTGKITPSAPTEQGKAMGSAIREALESGNVKRVKIF